MTIYGYVRVSTEKQETGSDAQRRALEAAGCEQIIEERASGRKTRPALNRLVEMLDPEDIVTVMRFDRISRSVVDFYAIGQQISARGAALRSLFEQFDTNTPMGRAMMGFAAVWAELEADTIRERVLNGIKAARARGTRLGRPPLISTDVQEAIRGLLRAGGEVKDIARLHRVSESTIRRVGRGQQKNPDDRMKAVSYDGPNTIGDRVLG